MEEELPQIVDGYGPLKWCKLCSRKHHRRATCQLVLIRVKAKSGRIVSRFVHPNRIGEDVG